MGGGDDLGRFKGFFSADLWNMFSPGIFFEGWDLGSRHPILINGNSSEPNLQSWENRKPMSGSPKQIWRVLMEYVFQLPSLKLTVRT